MAPVEKRSRENEAATPASPQTLSVPPELAGTRLDRALAELFPQYSRARLQRWLRDGLISVDGRRPRPRDKVQGGERVTLVAAQPTPQTEWRAETFALDIVYEDADIIVINKPPGLVVHPGAGNLTGTLVNGLLGYAPELAALPRAGVVHRLDKDTSGLLVVARSLRAHHSLVKQLASRRMGREYEALVTGVMTAGGEIAAPIGRHPVHRTRMATVDEGREAITHYRVVERFRAHTWIRIRLETGRTHQIRVHMAHIHHPVVGDPTYGGRLRIPQGCTDALREALRGFKRQALHAARLSLIHPATQEHREWIAPMPPDMAALIAVMRADREAAPVIFM
jgi:23S rRNA pseudouridine1911/1915/1917 synthase